ncbi:MAG: acyl-CoA thioesterase [Lachnospiraceae bacterium]
MKTYQHKVHYYETDKMGIVHHSNYIRWMEEARIDYFSQKGWEFEKLEELGIVSPVTAVDCKYRVSTRFADVIDISVKLEEFRGVKMKLSYEMRRGEELVCEGYSEHGFLDSEGKIISLKRSFPEVYKALIQD